MIDPRGLTFQEWSDAIIFTLPTSWQLSDAVPEDDWRVFAAQLMRVPELSSRIVPDPSQFTDWREWAERAAPMLETG